MEYGYVTIKGEFPVTYQNDNADENNIGWTRGVFDDGIPFAAELWEYGKQISITILIPAECQIPEPDKEVQGGNSVIPFQNEYTFTDGSSMPVGMVSLGSEVDPAVIHGWVDFLEEKGLIEFAGEWRNGSVQYVVDIMGNVFAEIVVCLMNDDEIYGITDLDWKPFQKYQEKQKKQKKSIFTVVK